MCCSLSASRCWLRCVVGKFKRKHLLQETRHPQSVQRRVLGLQVIPKEYNCQWSGEHRTVLCFLSVQSKTFSSDEMGWKQQIHSLNTQTNYRVLKCLFKLRSAEKGSCVSLTGVYNRDRKFLFRKLERMCRGVHEANCILLLIVGK
jgi:hypothetical protein